MVLSSFLLTPATALRYEKHDRTNREVSTNEALNLGLNKSGAGELGDAVGGGGTGVMYNPRRRVVQKGGMSERDEYYVRWRTYQLTGRELWTHANRWCLCRNLWPRTWTAGSRKEWRGGRGNQMGDYDLVWRRYVVFVSH